MLVEPGKQLKQIFQIEHNIAKNPNWPEANQLAIYKRGRGFELEATEKQIQVVIRAGLEAGTAGLPIRQARWPLSLACLPIVLKNYQQSPYRLKGDLKIYIFFQSLISLKVLAKSENVAQLIVALVPAYTRLWNALVSCYRGTDWKQLAK